MTMADDPELARFIAALQSIDIANNMLTAAGALYAYEYMITIGNEVDLFWKRKLTMASILFALNRYVPFIVTMMGVPYPVSDADYEGLRIGSAHSKRSQILPVSSMGCVLRLESLRTQLQVLGRSPSSVSFVRCARSSQLRENGLLGDDT
ncbi:hypothetical protein C8Q76DRAFT_448275 [Earliella scabrosa]|nr:hypothetical protein C8Q76DRAFT_448275 [Earliella scabrosa]